MPYTGVQFVGIPEFQALGTQVGQYLAGVLSGQMTVDQAMKQSQAAAEKVCHRRWLQEVTRNALSSPQSILLSSVEGHGEKPSTFPSFCTALKCPPTCFFACPTLNV